MLQVKKRFFGPFLRPVLANIETGQLILFFFYAGNTELNWPNFSMLGTVP